MSIPIKQIHDYAESLWPATQGILSFQLSAEDRVLLGAYLFDTAPLFVGEVAGALHDAPQLFPDVPVNGADLSARQGRATMWRRVADQLALLAGRARDAFLYEQGMAIREALLAYRQVEAEANLPADLGLPRRERRYALHLAGHWLRDRERRRKLIVRRRELARADAQGVKLPLPPSGRRRDAIARGKRSFRLDVLRDMTDGGTKKSP